MKYENSEELWEIYQQFSQVPTSTTNIFEYKPTKNMLKYNIPIIFLLTKHKFIFNQKIRFLLKKWISTQKFDLYLKIYFYSKNLLLL